MVMVDLAVSWGRIGVAAFGSGPALVPYMKAECVDVRGWMTEEQFLDALALAYSLPGPISAKMSVFAGLQAGGPAGAITALIAVIAPPAVLMLSLLSVYARYRDAQWLQGAMTAVRPAIVGLLVWAAIDLAPTGVRSWQGAALCAGAVAALFLRVHPVVVMLTAMGIGAAFFRT